MSGSGSGEQGTAAGRTGAPPIRAARGADLVDVLALNEANVPAVNSIAIADLEWFLGEAEHFRVAEVDGSLGGFVIALGPDVPYQSPNYRWVSRRLSGFLYIDRIVVSAAFQRRGVGSALYASAAQHAAGRYAGIACEVNIRPRNEESIQFHERLGFEWIGSQDHGYVEVQYMALPLVPGAARELFPRFSSSG